MKKTIIINLFGGPCAGKSTNAAGVFYELKTKGVNCELITEYAKDKVWEESLHTLDNQLYVFAKQYHRIFRVHDKVDIIVTDAPLLLSLYYGNHLSDNFKNLVKETVNQFNNVNFFLNRIKKYNPIGRLQTEDEAKGIDVNLKEIFKENNIPYYDINGDDEASKIIANTIYEMVKENN
ncbi:MAG: AAA family ATPase [archaeon]